MEMIGQDYLSRAAENVVDFQVLKGKLEQTLEDLKESKRACKDKSDQLDNEILTR